MLTTRHRMIARNIAAVLLAGEWTHKSMSSRLQEALGAKSKRALSGLVRSVLARHKSPVPPSIGALAKLVIAAPSFERVALPLLRSSAPVRMVLSTPRFAPLVPLSDVGVPQLSTPGDIASWLGLPIDQIDWFTDARRTHHATSIPNLQHYTYAFRAKAHGPPRLIEAPKPRLKTMQRHILRDILDHLPAHDAAHGFVKSRSCRSGAEMHVGAHVVVCFDIADHFLTTPLGRVHALFRRLGYPDAAARVLTRLCSTATPEAVFDRVPSPRKHTRSALRAYMQPHLPQGAPTSPALANLVARRLDIRLTGLAASLGGRYSRYADDLTFSGDAAFARKTNSLVEAVNTIVEDEGYELNARKTRVMTSSRRQQVTGIVVNAHSNVARDSFDNLKAILHNCRKNGLEAENRDGHADFRAHLEGRVGWVESLNPARGRKLRVLLAAIP